MLCSLEAIAQHKMLRLTVVGISLVAALVTGEIVWGSGGGDRNMMKFNRPAIENCYEKFATDHDGNGWFSCPGIQLQLR